MVAWLADVGRHRQEVDDAELLCWGRWRLWKVWAIVIYHHTSRRKKAHEEISERLCLLEERFNCAGRALALRYHRGTSRSFIIVPQARHAEIISTRVKAMLGGPWSTHFERVPR